MNRTIIGLKATLTTFSWSNVTSLNRTIIGLKASLKAFHASSQACLNRTIIGLKAVPAVSICSHIGLFESNYYRIESGEVDNGNTSSRMV